MSDVILNKYFADETNLEYSIEFCAEHGEIYFGISSDSEMPFATIHRLPPFFMNMLDSVSKQLANSTRMSFGDEEHNSDGFKCKIKAQKYGKNANVILYLFCLFDTGFEVSLSIKDFQELMSEVSEKYSLYEAERYVAVHGGKEKLEKN